MSNVSVSGSAPATEAPVTSVEPLRTSRTGLKSGGSVVVVVVVVGGGGSVAGGGSVVGAVGVGASDPPAAIATPPPTIPAPPTAITAVECVQVVPGPPPHQVLLRPREDARVAGCVRRHLDVVPV